MAGDRVQELAKLTVKAPYTTDSPDLCTHLRTVIATLNKASGSTFQLFKQVENDMTFYISGQWESTDAHNTFIRSLENQHLLNICEPYVQLESLMHILQRGDAVLDGSVPCLQVAIYSIQSAKAVNFEAMYTRVQPVLQRWTTQQQLATGWVAEFREEQFVVLSPWQDISGPQAFGTGDDFRNYGPPLQEFLTSVDIKHLTPWRI